MAAVERRKPEGKVLEVRVKLREEDARTASGCARAEGLSRLLLSCGSAALRRRHRARLRAALPRTT
jgi:hypothetical protein